MCRLHSLPGTGLVGFATAKKIGGKPDRNRARRRFQAALRAEAGLPDPRFDVVLVIGTSATDAPFARIQEEVRTLFGKTIERWESEWASS